VLHFTVDVMADNLPTLRVKHPAQDRAQFLDRHAARVASTGIQVPTANLRPVGSRVRLIIELKSGESIVGDAVVEAHVRIREAPGISLRYVRLHEGGIVFPLPERNPPIPRPGALARPTPPAQPAVRAAPTPVARAVTPRVPFPAVPMPAVPAAPARDLLDAPQPFPGLDGAPDATLEVPIDVPPAPPEAPAAPPPSITPPPAPRVGLTLDDLQLDTEPEPARADSAALSPAPDLWDAPAAAPDLWDAPATAPDLRDAPATEPAVARLAPPEFAAPEPAVEPPLDAGEDATATPPASTSHRSSGRRALVLTAALLVVLVAAGSAYLLLRRRSVATTAANATPATPVTATCEQANGTVDVRRRGEVGVWHALAAGGALRSGDVVRTGPASSARLAFAAGGALELEADATVEIGVSAPATKGGAASPAESTVAVEAGVVRGVLPSASDAGPVGLVVRGADGSTTRLATAKGSTPATIRLTRAPTGTEVAVTGGEVEVGSGQGGQKVSAGRAIDLPPAAGRPVVELLEFPASIAPGVDARFKWRKGLEVRLAWKKVASAAGYRVQVSRSLSFETVSRTLETDGTAIAFAPEAEGLYAWRVASRDGAGRFGEYGFARRLYCDRSSSLDLLVGPADRETVKYAGPDSPIAFTWQSAADAKAYRLLVATSPRLRARPVVNRVTKEQRVEVKDLAPGSYYWGVFAGEGPTAKPIFQKPRSLVITPAAKASGRARR
jgi:hypothetical protein